MITGNITPPTSLFIDPRTGTIAREWYLFLIGLTRTLEAILAQFNLGTAHIAFIDEGSSDSSESDLFIIPGPPGTPGQPGPQGPASGVFADSDPAETPLLGIPSPAAQVVTGSKAAGAALVSLLAALGSSQLGLIIDQTTV